MAWFRRDKSPIASADKSSRVPEGMWIKCSYCPEIIYRKELVKNMHVCPKCSYHFRISARDRIRILLDEGSFVPFGEELSSADPLQFRDSKKYPDRVRESRSRADGSESLMAGAGSIDGKAVQVCVFDFAFMGGSMGAVAGERITRAIERAVARNTPLLIVSCSGGARMQEGLYSLMQMAKTSAALTKLGEAALPYISILADPTTGGVSASFAMLGDVIIAEPKALIGFAGPRVIEQTIGEKLPEGFQRAEFLLEHGLIDLVVSRSKLRETVSNLIDFFGK